MLIFFQPPIFEKAVQAIALKKVKDDYWNPFPTGEQGARKPRKRIALVCNGKGPSVDAVGYALNACESLGAGLDLLHFGSPGQGRTSLERVLDDLSGRGTEFRLLAPGGDERNGILRYANETADTLFVVIDSKSWKSISGTGSSKRGTLSPWDSQCPLVVISETTSLTKSRGEPVTERPARRAPTSARKHHETRGGGRPTT